METTLVHRTFRGVPCRHFNCPIRLRAPILSRECAFKLDETNFTQQLCSKVFSHRCRTCGEESIDAYSQILDFEDESAQNELPSGQGR